MSIETALLAALDTPTNNAAADQIGRFREFERKLKESGFEIQRQTFNIPLMGGVTSGHHQI